MSGCSHHASDTCWRFTCINISPSLHVWCCPLVHYARRVKMLLNTAKPHNQVDAEVASGMGRPDNGPKLRSHGPAAMEMVQ
jgi:hypothetical protein